MRHLLWLLLLISFAAPAAGQSNQPVRLAIIADTPDASAVSDLLTTELSTNSQVTLLERNEIEKVYREQGLSAANRDYLKLGQTLGADGLLLIRANATADTTPAFAAAFGGNRNSAPKFDLGTQLIAVKPGVLLASEQFSAISDLPHWSEGFAPHLSPYLPKLSVLVKDAVPVSVVNFRSAIQSPETKEVERQLTSLAIERLSRERQLFVLERTKMQMLAAEKDLKGMNDSTFWNGSYLLEGTIDRDGYSPGKITISARLVPPRGGAPVAIELSGSRTNLSEAINRLVEKVREGLKLAGNATPWNTADEAQKYFEEAKWALRWNLHQQGLSAADSAWALGKQDLDCALVRTKAYLVELSTELVTYQTTSYELSSAYDKAGNPVGPAPSDAEVQSVIRAETSKHPGLIYRIQRDNAKRSVLIPESYPESQPNALAISDAFRVLDIYYNFSRTHPEGQPQPGTSATNWKNSPWTDLGINVLIAASKVLRDFNFASDSQKSSAAELGELRALTRTVADFISRPPSVQDTYFVGNRPAPRDELCHTLQENSNIFSCELNWAAFWQEKPEETIAVYRKLLSSAAFCYLHGNFWNRELTQPRLAAWNDEDKKRIPVLWESFETELKNSTNVLWQMEAVALAKSDADSQEKVEAADAAWWKIVRAHREELIANNVELFYLGWGFASTEETRQMDQEYWGKTIPVAKTAWAFPRQKKYLAEFAPYNFEEFNNVFADREYSMAQASELRPLLNAYQSNLIAQADANTSPTNGYVKFKAQSDVRWTANTLGNRLNEILTPKTPLTSPSAIATSAAAPPAVAVAQPPRPSTPVSKPASPAPSEIPVNALIARKFLPIPTNQLPATNLANLAVFSHRMRDGKLLLNLQYLDWWMKRWVDEQGNTNSQQVNNYHEAGAVLQPNGSWDMTVFPRVAESMTQATDFLQGAFGISEALGAQLYVELFGDAIYVSDPEVIRHYDIRAKKWSELPFPGQERAQLYAVDDHLYAASAEGIWEILDDGKSSHLLASVRRQPPVSLLDSRASLGKPLLFSGKDHALWVALKGEVFAWDGSDWKPILTVNDTQITLNSQGTLFFRVGRPMQAAELWRLAPNETRASLCLRDAQTFQAGMYNQPAPQSRADAPQPLWKSPGRMRLNFNQLTVDDSKIFLISSPPQTSATTVNDRRLEANLVCLLPGNPEPLTIPIRFDEKAGPVTLHIGPNRPLGLWVEFASKDLLIGAPGLPGVWTVPKSEIEAEIQRQIAARPTQRNKTLDVRDKPLLAKFDLNHDGRLDMEEWETAISDPAFLSAEMDKIDLNGNGQLDLDELAYFDINQNDVLEAPEMAGILTFQHLLAVKAFKEFDVNRNGNFDREEMDAFTRNKGRSFSAMSAMQTLRSTNEVGRIEHYLQYATEEQVHQALGKLMISGFATITLYSDEKKRADTLRNEIELYWAKEKE